MDVGADEYMNWGRTRLRVELKKRGLSPSGLKTELLARLEEYFKRQKSNHAGSTQGGRSALTTSVHTVSAAGSYGRQTQQLLPRQQHHSKKLLSLFHQQHNQQQLSRQQTSSDTTSPIRGGPPRKRPRKSQTPHRGLLPAAGAEETAAGGFPHNGRAAFEFDQPERNENYKRPRQQVESDESSGNEGSPLPTASQSPLSGRIFKKESGQVPVPHAEVRSVETILFGPGNQFHFTHRFWRGKLLRRRFDFYGTYSIVATTPPAPSRDLDELVANRFAGEEVAATHAEESRLKELTEGKVILHWPSKLDAPELRDWQFDKSYSHLFLAMTPSSSTPPQLSRGLGSSSDGASLLQPGSTSPVLTNESATATSQTLKRQHFLYTKHSAVFVEDNC